MPSLARASYVLADAVIGVLLTATSGRRDGPNGEAATRSSGAALKSARLRLLGTSPRASGHGWGLGGDPWRSRHQSDSLSYGRAAWGVDCLLAALGCGFALAHYDLLFAAIFALAMGIAFTAAMRRWP